MGLQQLVKVKGIPILPALPPWLAFTQGNVYHCKPESVADGNDVAGSNDGNDGLTPETAVTTLAAAYALCTAGQNDIVLLYSQSNTASTTFDYLAAGFTWSKNCTHLIGVDSGVKYGKRAGLRFAAAYDAAAPLFTLSGNNCYIANVYFYSGVAGTSTLGAVSVSGQHNHFYNCHIAGMGASTNVVNGAYSLKVSGLENAFTECMIGYGQQRGVTGTTSELLYAAGAGREVFKDCIFFCGTSSATNHVMFIVPVNGNLDFTLFDHCKFINAGVNGGGTNITYAFTINANPGGTVLCDNCSSAGITDWSDNSGFVWAQTEGAAGTGGIGAVQTK